MRCFSGFLNESMEQHNIVVRCSGKQDSGRLLAAIQAELVDGSFITPDLGVQNFQAGTGINVIQFSVGRKFFMESRGKFIRNLI